MARQGGPPKGNRSAKHPSGAMATWPQTVVWGGGKGLPRGTRNTSRPKAMQRAGWRLPPTSPHPPIPQKKATKKTNMPRAGKLSGNKRTCSTQTTGFKAESLTEQQAKTKKTGPPARLTPLPCKRNVALCRLNHFLEHEGNPRRQQGKKASNVWLRKKRCSAEAGLSWGRSREPHK